MQATPRSCGSAGSPGPQHASHPGDGGLDANRKGRNPSVDQRRDRLLDAHAPNGDRVLGSPSTAGADLTTNRPEARGISRQRHQIRATPIGWRNRAHRHRQADEGRRAYGLGHRHVPGCQPCDSVPLSRHCLTAPQEVLTKRGTVSDAILTHGRFALGGAVAVAKPAAITEAASRREITDEPLEPKCDQRC